MFIKTNRETSITRIQNDIINFVFFEDNLLEVVKVAQCRQGEELWQNFRLYFQDIK